MSEPFLGEVRMFGFNFAPRNWALCNGQLLSIAANSALFSLLGTAYGGDGRTTFGLPDLRGRTPVHVGTSTTLGEVGGSEWHTLSAAETPSHTHVVQGTDDPATTNVAGSGVLANATLPVYGNPDSSGATMAAGSVRSVGGQSHHNMSPFQTVNFCIALVGVFPS